MAKKLKSSTKRRLTAAFPPKPLQNKIISVIYNCMKLKHRLIITALVILFSGVVLVEPAVAANCGDINTFFEWGCGPANTDEEKANVVWNVIVNIFNWLAVGVVIAVVGGIIYGGITYGTAGGNAEQSKKGMGIIRNAFIALILYFAMFTLVNFLVPGGLFT
jgi:hypothetical protein